MQLSAILDAIPPEFRGTDSESGDGQRGIEISGIAYDSRRVETGDLFFALRGEAAEIGRAHV